MDERIELGEAGTKSLEILDEMTRLWEKFLRTIGPVIVEQYLQGNLSMSPADWVREGWGGKYIDTIEKLTDSVLIALELSQDEDASPK